VKSSEILRKAQEELKRRGWHRGEFAPHGVVAGLDCPMDELPCCVWGAINAAVTGDPRNWEFLGDDPGTNGPLRYLERAIQMIALDGSEARSAPWWNDHVANSVDEVLAGLEKAAVLAEGAGD
jgi:hypothetical protein